MLSEITGMQLMCTRMSQLQAQSRISILQAQSRISIEHAALAKLSIGDAARRVCAMARDILAATEYCWTITSPGTTPTLRPSTPMRAWTPFSPSSWDARSPESTLLADPRREPIGSE